MRTTRFIFFGFLILLFYFPNLIAQIKQPNFWFRTNGCPDLNIIKAIVINSSKYIYTAGNKGVFRSADDGNHWTKVSTFTSTTESLTISPSDHIFAGTTEGIYRSTDNGESWELVGPENKYVLSFAISPSGHIFAAGTSGVFRSTDDGKHWIKVRNAPSSNSTIVISPSGHIFVGSGVTRSIHRSTDDGDNWTQVWAPSSAYSQEGIFSITINASGIILASTNKPRIIRSINDGNSWSDTGPILVTGRVLLITPLGHIFVGSPNGVWRSIDNGESWSNINSGMQRSSSEQNWDHIWSLAIDSSGYIWAGGLGDIYRSTYSATSRK